MEKIALKLTTKVPEVPKFTSYSRMIKNDRDDSFGRFDIPQKIKRLKTIYERPALSKFKVPKNYSPFEKKAFSSMGFRFKPPSVFGSKNVKRGLVKTKVTNPTVTKTKTVDGVKTEVTELKDPKANITSNLRPGKVEQSYGVYGSGSKRASYIIDELYKIKKEGI